MRRIHAQAGSGLVLIIGVVAALAVLAAAIVVLITNAQSNTSRDRARSQAFNVAEAGLDRVMSTLAGTWPYTAGEWAGIPSTFWDQFSNSGVDFPAPRTGPRGEVRIFDNVDSNGDGVIGYTATKGWDDAFDGNKDELVYVESQGAVGNTKARVQALVRLSFLNVGLLQNVVLYTPGTTAVNSSNIVSAEVVAPGTDVAQAYFFDQTGNGTLSGQVLPNEGSKWDTDEMITPEMLALLKQAAIMRNTYWKDINSATLKDRLSANPKLLAGVIYIDSPGEALDFPSNLSSTWTGDGVGVLNSEGEVAGPGALIVNASSFKWQGNAAYYGLIYCTGNIDYQGTAQIHGILVSADESDDGKPSISLSGNQSITYNDNVRQNLNVRFPSSVKVMQNTWREITPM